MLAGIGQKLKDDLTSELLSTIQDILVTAGYFRARLNIDPFDKILGGMCWCITGSNNDIDLEYEDDLNMGQKVRIAEQITNALQNMMCPYKLYPH